MANLGTGRYHTQHSKIIRQVVVFQILYGRAPVLTPQGQECHFSHVDLSQPHLWNGTMLHPVTDFLAQMGVTAVGLSLTLAGYKQAPPKNYINKSPKIILIISVCLLLSAISVYIPIIRQQSQGGTGGHGTHPSTIIHSCSHHHLGDLLTVTTDSTS